MEALARLRKGTELAGQCQAELTLARREEAARSRVIGLVKAIFPEFSGAVGFMFVYYESMERMLLMLDTEIRTRCLLFLMNR